jgi:lysozyme
MTLPNIYTLMKLVSIVSDILNEQISSTFAASKSLDVLANNQNSGYKMGKGPFKGPISYSNRAVELIKKFEKFVDKTYLCSAGKKTIGYGTRLDYHPEIKKNVCITEPKAVELLKTDLDKLVTPVIKDNVTIKLKQNQIDALYSLIHNIGMDNFVNSNLLKMLNNKKFNNMKKDWQEFQMADGRVLKGLVKRRQEELALFFS